MNFETGRRGGNGEQMQKTQLLLNGGGVSRHERSRYSGVEADNATAEGLARSMVGCGAFEPFIHCNSTTADCLHVSIFPIIHEITATKLPPLYRLRHDLLLFVATYSYQCNLTLLGHHAVINMYTW
ncbi:unnamed protein product [Brassica oleracea]